jgi:hypothetical protein
MSASIIQKKAAFATVTGSGSVEVTLDTPISAGSSLVISAALVQSNGSGNAPPAITVEDDLTNSYSPTAYSKSGSSFFANIYQGGGIPQAGARTYTLNFTAPTGQSGYTFLAGLCVYEVSNINVFTNESASESLTGLHEVSDYSATISGLSGGSFGNLLVGIYASLFSSSLSDANQVSAGSGWTLDGRDAINGTFSPMAIAFESQFVDASSNPAVVFSGSSNITALDGAILVGANSLTSAGSGGGGAPTPSGPAFLGSVRVVGSAPSGARNNFLGTVTVVDSAPAGAANPYLGSVVVGTPTGGDSNPTLGEVVVVASVPAGENDVFLGTAQES